MNRYFERKRRGEIAEKDTQTEMQPLPRQSFSRQLLLASPGVLAILGEMTVYQLRTVAKDYELRTSGDKQTLIARIRYYLTADF